MTLERTLRIPMQILEGISFREPALVPWNQNQIRSNSVDTH